MPKPSLVIVTPVLNDWDSLGQLVLELGELKGLQDYRVTLLAVDDGSITITPPPRSALKGGLVDIVILRLKANQGHQRAIALGLAYAYNNLAPDRLAVMDSDGEDRPVELENMLAAAADNPDAILVAQRRRRSESFVFRAFYALYKLMFFGLTGKPISFGNFSVIPGSRLENILFNPGVWNNFAATVLKCRIPIQFVPTSRGQRYFGKSKMSFTGLMIHGFSAISVFTDIVIGRIIALLSAVSVFVGIAIVGVILVKLTTSIFVPGYATNLIMFLSSLLALSLLLGFFMILSLLASREQAASLPTRLVEGLAGDVTVISRAVVADSVAS